MKPLEKGDLSPGTVARDYLCLDQDFIVLSKYAVVTREDAARIEQYDLVRLAEDAPPENQDEYVLYEPESRDAVAVQDGESGPEPEWDLRNGKAGASSWDEISDALAREMLVLVRERRFDYAAVRRTAADLGMYFVSSSDAALSRVARGAGRRRHLSHWLHVGILTAALGSVDPEVKDLSTLVAAALLHDIGIPLLAAKRPDTDGADASPAPGVRDVRLHTHIGHRFLLDHGADEPAVMTALQHHENAEGTGYPSGLRLESISKSARIVGVCDNWDNQINLVRFGGDLALHYTRADFLSWKPELYERSLYENFLRVIGNAGVRGGDVVLNDGRAARVEKVSIRFPLNPIVRARDGETVDLRKTGNLWISTWSA